MKWKIENLKTAAITWAITIILLFIASIYNYITKQELGIVGIVFFASLVVYFMAYIILTNKKNK
jgi:exosortase/archaeosortase